MAQILTSVAHAARAAWSSFTRDALFPRKTVRVTVRLDRSSPGAHLIWDIVNGGTEPAAITTLVMSAPRGERSTVTLEHERIVGPGDHLVFPVDVDWSLLAARTLAVVDARGREYYVSERQVKAVQEQLRHVIDRRAYTPRSASDFLFGAADLAFGVAILGLGLFMLMWVIATG